VLRILLPALLAVANPEVPEPPVAPHVEAPPAVAVPPDAPTLPPLPASALAQRPGASGQTPAPAPEVAPVSAPASTAPATTVASTALPAKTPKAAAHASRTPRKTAATTAAAAAASPAVPPTPEELGAPAVPPSLTSKAFLDEVRQTAVEQRSSRQRRDDDRSRLEKLAKEIADARAALRQETERLEVAQKAAEHKRPSTAPPSPEASAGPPASDPSPYGALAKTVKGMRPEKAAEVVAHLDKGLAVELLRRIRPTDAAAILERLKPEAAAELVGRMAAPGTEAP